jgi:DNA-binding SARP family transcriptional activator/tetratricopeptide (TPR) repeat protein
VGGGVEFRILGSLAVIGDDGPVVVPGAKCRALLALLLVRANELVPSGRLIEDLWEGDPPESATPTLQSYVYQVRKSLGPGSVRTGHTGYVLELEPDRLDALRFEGVLRDVAAADRAAPGWIAARLGEALDWWRGSPLADFEDASWARPEITRLEELRIRALEDRIDARLALGEHTRLVSDVESLVGQHPLRERLWRQLMVALYRSDRQAEALRAYGRLRQHLGEELGIEPSNDLARLEEAILLHKPELDWQPGLAASTPGERLSTLMAHGLRERPSTVSDLSRGSASEPIPTQSALRRRTGELFVGRGAELELVREAWTQTLRGDRRVVLIGGEPGVGKTRLAAELACAARDDGALILHGRCDEGMGVPYQPFVEALRDDVHLCVGTGLRERLGRYAGELVRLVPEIGDELIDLPARLRSDPETEQYRLFDAVAGWLAAVSAQSPALLVLDDLHWATAPTVLLLRHLVRWSDPVRLMIIGTYRNSELAPAGALGQLLADLRGAPGVERVELCGLDEPDVRAFVAGVVGYELGGQGQAFARAVHDQTSGNPFFVSEVLRNLVESGGVFQRDGGWVNARVEEFGIPAGVREVVRRRVDRLPASTGDALVFAAVIGPEFETRVLEAVVGIDADALLGALDEAVAAGLLAEGGAGCYRFAHALVQAALYDQLSAARRARMHRRVGDAVETVYAARLEEHFAELAHHFMHAAPDSATEKAIEYTIRAAERALTQLAPQDAVRYYRQVLELVEFAGGPFDEGRRCDLLIALGDAQRRSGDPAHGETLLDAARVAQHIDDSDRLARAALTARSRTFAAARGESKRVAVLEAALAAVGEEDTPVRARLLATLAGELAFGGERPFGLSDEALAIARRVDDPATLVEVLEQRLHSNRWSGNLAERLALSAEAADLAEQLADPASAWPVAWQGLWTAWEAGDRDLADRLFDLLDRLSNELDQPAPRYFAAICRTTRTMIQGAPDEVERLAVATLELGQKSGQPDPIAFFGVAILAARRFQDRLAERFETAEAHVARYPWMPVMDCALALIYCDLDRPEDARSIFEQLASGDFAFPDDALWTQSMAYCAEICAELDDAKRAETLYERLAPYRDHFVVPGAAWLGSVAHYLGLLATTVRHFDAADVDFAHAAAEHERLEAAPWLALTRLAWAGMLLTRNQQGDAEHARELLDQALDTARELGLAMVERRAAALPRRTP